MLISTGTFIFVSLLLTLFYLLGKNFKFSNSGAQSFECGFSSYFFTRFTFSIQYFMVALVFLFLDMEICMIIPILISESWYTLLEEKLLIFVTVLFAGLLVEWVLGKLDWTY